MMSDGCSNLSDVFYMFKQAGEHFTQQIRECIKANELFDYIPAVVCADDISYVNDRLISGLLDELAHNLNMIILLLIYQRELTSLGALWEDAVMYIYLTVEII